MTPGDTTSPLVVSVNLEQGLTTILDRKPLQKERNSLEQELFQLREKMQANDDVMLEMA